ncbi:hypothetical protein P3T43_004919 [Paraburkholderia sp. GAS41]|uniref:hypothetical protein n=1 Tax=Paraburkholderia sp. GAS41 TaxID=3035134 RepID=UPI003D247314
MMDDWLAEERNRIAVGAKPTIGGAWVGSKKAQAGCVTRGGDWLHNKHAISHKSVLLRMQHAIS